MIHQSSPCPGHSKDYVSLRDVPRSCKHGGAKPFGKQHLELMSMEAARRHGRILRATLCEIERGVFYATYFQDRAAPDTEGLPRYHVGRSASDAKQQLEGSARALGYEAVNWTESIVIPAFAAPAETASRARLAEAAPRKRVAA
jgi:hypothetical protein